VDMQEEADEFIRYYVWSGYYEPDEVYNIIDDELLESDCESQTWLRAAIQREFQSKHEAEKTWPNITDCDRLDRAFESLRRQGILTRHRAGFTQQDGLEVVEGLYEEAGGAESDITGYCFYTTQDMEAAMWGTSGLLLAFGHFSGDSQEGADVGRHVRDVSEEHGLRVV
jgi:hypothetical protein